MNNDSVLVRREMVTSGGTLADWDRLVRTTAGTDVTQLSAWAAIRAQAGYLPVYLLAYQDGLLVGGALVLHRRVFGLASIGYLPYGPVIAPDLPARAEVGAALANELARFAAARRAMFVQPPEGAQDVSDALLARGFRPSRAGIAPTGSYRLDLTRPLDEIRAGFSKRLKSWTNRWEARGVTVRKGDERDLPTLVRLMAHTGARQGFRPPPLSYVQNLYRELARDGHAAIFIGCVHRRPVSADVVTICAGMVRGRFCGFDSCGETGKLSVPAAVRWKIIEWARELGYQYLDFGGLPESMLTDMIDRGIRSSDSWPSAHCGKLAFNGAPFRYPTAVELVRAGPTRFGYDLLRHNELGKKVITTARGMLRSGFLVD